MIQAARYLGVSPWELLESPVEWLIWTSVALDAEARAARTRSEPGWA